MELPGNSNGIVMDITKQLIAMGDAYNTLVGKLRELQDENTKLKEDIDGLVRKEVADPEVE